MTKKCQPRRTVTRQVAYPQFTLGNLTNLIGVPFITGLIVFGGFYYTTGETLRRHDEEIRLAVKKNDEERQARERVRDEFLSSQQKTADGISKLDTRLAVAESQQTIMVQQLGKIADAMQRFAPPASSTPR